MNGFDVSTDFAEIQKVLGVCPQQNALIDLMTVREHLEFYGKLKSKMSKEKLTADIDSLLESMGLWYLQREKVAHLSEGMKRRLCVGIAFVGGSKVIVLDEPTSGVDPVARRYIWDLIEKYRTGRTILLTTHQLDEAEILSDRVAIMHKGRILCCRSPLSLKTKYGTGYKLTVSKIASKISASTVDAVDTIVKRCLPDAVEVETTPNEKVYALGLPNTDTQKFEKLFRELEDSEEELKIQYGLSCTTLEEVFQSVCMMGETNKDTNGVPTTASYRSPRKNYSGSSASESTRIGEILKREYNTGMKLSAIQFHTLVYKRFWHHVRDWKFFLAVILLPALLIALAMGISLIKPSDLEDPQLLMTPALYGNDRKSFYVDRSVGSSLSSALLTDTGIGTHCMSDMTGLDGVPQCHRSSVSMKNDYMKRGSNRSCECNKMGYQECTGDYLGYIPPKWTAATSDILFDLTNHSASDWIVLTENDYIEERYGGWSFGINETSEGTLDNILVWYDNKGYHAVPSYYSATTNAILRSKVSDPTEYGISTFNHPLHLSNSRLSARSIATYIADVGIALIIMMAFCFILANVVIYVITERTSEEKRLQFVSGVSPFLYWSSSFIWDFAVALLGVTITVIIILCFGLPSYTARNNLGAVVLLLLCYCWAVIPLMYLLEKLFSSPSLASLLLFCTSIFIALVTMTTVMLLALFYWVESLQKINRVLRVVFLIFPQYALGGGLIDIVTNYAKWKVFERFGQDAYVNPVYLLQYNILALIVEGIVFFILNLLLEYRNSVLKSGHQKSSKKDHRLEDKDVSTERKRMHQSWSSDNDILQLVDLRKVYNSALGRNIAVDALCLGVPRGECFGLLGLNGAGKSTTFKILTGEIQPSAGKALVNGQHVSKAVSSGMLGYCPQTDAIDTLLTAEEILYVYAKLRGFMDCDVQQIISESSEKFGLTRYIKDTTKTYSGGTKRKLCAAISVLGSPDIVLLDEPTSGMDPASRRLVWSAVRELVQTGCSVILTSHSMEECDTICDRVAIMVNGELQCLGSPQNLKNRFGDGYSLSLRSAMTGQFDNIATWMSSAFPSSVLKSKHHTTIEYTVSAPLSYIFQQLARFSEKLDIVDFCITQTTLDEVFINFASQQTDGIVDDMPSDADRKIEGFNNPVFDPQPYNGTDL